MNKPGSSLYWELAIWYKHLSNVKIDSCLTEIIWHEFPFVAMESLYNISLLAGFTVFCYTVLCSRLRNGRHVKTPVHSFAACSHYPGNGMIYQSCRGTHDTDITTTQKHSTGLRLLRLSTNKKYCILTKAVKREQKYEYCIDVKGFFFF